MYPDQLGLPFTGSQDWVGGGTFGFDNEFWLNSKYPQQQVQHHHHQYFLQQREEKNNQLLAFVNNNNNNFVFSASRKDAIKNNNVSNCATGYSQSVLLLAQVEEKQRQEMDTYIDLQSQILKSALQEQSKRDVVTILRKFEQRASILLREKDEEIGRASKRASELEQLTRRMEEEIQVWKRIAGKKEAMVLNLNNTLEQLRTKVNEVVEDAESCCCDYNTYPGGGVGWVNEKGTYPGGGVGWVNEKDTYPGGGGGVGWVNEKDTYPGGGGGGDGGGDGDGGRVGVNEKEDEKRNSSSNDNRNSSCNCGEMKVVVFLPCRHLSSCKSCATLLQACPLCNSPKNATIEALIS